MSLGRSLVAPLLRVVCLALLFFVPTATSAETVMVGDVAVDPRDFASDRDPQTRLAPCLACHGTSAGGDADFGPDVRFGTPALRGMRESYLQQSLMDYKTGRRSNEEMRVVAQMLNAEAIDFMARAFASYPAAPLKSADELAALARDDPLFRHGEAIARDGLVDKDLPACIDCHGALGEGDADLGPRLAGQNGLYVRRQLAEYAANARRTEQAEIMQPIAAGLSDEEMKAVAHYYERLIRTGDL